jgi:major membrane immunogen (membrane-anchored lipoprotein)
MNTTADLLLLDLAIALLEADSRNRADVVIRKRNAHGITRVSIAKVSGKHLSEAANAPLSAADRALADSFAGPAFDVKGERQ